MIVAMCCTRNWYTYLSTEIYALTKHNKVKKIYLFIEDDDILELKDKRIKFININKVKQYISENSPNFDTKYSQMSYVRCYFSKIIKDSKVLYLDTDALVVDNIQELWDMNIKDYAVAGVKEPGKWDRHLKIEGMDDNYINSGVMLMNLDYIRKHKIDDKMIELLNNNFYHFPDQDVINITCKGQVKYISNRYNSTETTGIVNNAKIVHYIRENKGWKRTSPRSEIWFRYYKEILKNRDDGMVKLEITEWSTLYSRFNEIKSIRRYGEEREGELFAKDIVTCKEDLAKFLLNEKGYENPVHRAVARVIEVIPGGEE